MSFCAWDEQFGKKKKIEKIKLLLIEQKKYLFDQLYILSTVQ